MAVNPGAQIIGLDQASALEGLNAPAIAFTLRTSGGDHRLCLVAADIPQFVAFLVGAATAFDDASPNEELEVEPPSNYAVPVAAKRLLFSTTDDPTVALVGVQLAGFRLDFSLPAAELASMGPRLARLGLVLSADPKSPQ